MYATDANNVFYNRELVYSAPGEIVKALPFGKHLILHYDVLAEDINNVSEEEAYQNVLSIDFNGCVLWRLPKPEKTLVPAFQPDYRNIRIDNEGSFWAGDGAAYENKFDPNTGKILESVFTK